MFATLSFVPMVGMSSDLPLNENEDVRAITCNPGVFARRSSNSSASPSEKYSWSFFSLKSANGKTAMDFSAITAGDAIGAGAVAAGSLGCSESALMARYTIDAKTSPDTIHQVSNRALRG